MRAPVFGGTRAMIAECLLLDVFHEDGPAHLTAQAADFADAHGSQHFDQLAVPGAHEVDHALGGIVTVG